MKYYTAERERLY